jgi:UDP-N-acetyl-D-mannosaminuronate dehydrogenase
MTIYERIIKRESKIAVVGLGYVIRRVFRYGIKDKLNTIGYEFDEELNQFK